MPLDADDDGSVVIASCDATPLTANVLLVLDRLPPVTPDVVDAVNVHEDPAALRSRFVNVATPDEFVLTVVVPLRVPQPLADMVIGALLTAVPLVFLYVTAGLGERGEPTVPRVGWVVKETEATASDPLPLAGVAPASPQFDWV